MGASQHQLNLRHPLLLLIIACYLLSSACSAGYMTLQFQQYNNQDSRCSDGTFCDTILFFNAKESACDPIFRLTADKAIPGGTNLFDYQQANYYDNQDVINFGASFGQIPNPVVIAMKYDDNPGSIQITVTVLDHDTSVNDYIDTFAASLTATGTEKRSLVMNSLPMGHSLSLQYWFTCNSNYYGALCNTYCQAQNDATNGHYTCDSNGQKVCLSGWIGPVSNCKTPHPCNVGVCQNGATCVPQGESYICRCRADFTGVNCEQFLNPCQYRNPCTNGGQCSLDASSQPVCRCPAQFSGAQCQQDVDECEAAAGSPCSNGMPCLNTFGGYRCNCTDTHFAGDLCDLQVCNGTVCLNNGTCTPGSDRVPRCSCPDGFAGRTCEQNLDDCVSSPCLNGATCRDLVADFACSCTNGFSGRLCELNVDDCASSPCQNGATCHDLVANFTCTCPLGFAGRLCEQNLNDCASSPCRNGGSCTDGIANFSCVCTAGYSGRVCERPPASPNVTADLLVGRPPDSDASGSGASVSVVGAAVGSAAGCLALVAIVLLGVHFLRHRTPNDGEIPDDASSSAFSNAVYHNAADCATRNVRPDASTAAGDNEGEYGDYETIGGDRVNHGVGDVDSRVNYVADGIESRMNYGYEAQA